MLFCREISLVVKYAHMGGKQPKSDDEDVHHGLATRYIDGGGATVTECDDHHLYDDNHHHDDDDVHHGLATRYIDGGGATVTEGK